MSKDTMPRWIQQFWFENPTKYSEDDISHFEPSDEAAVFLKLLTLNGEDVGHQKFLAEDTMPEWIQEFWRENPTEYTKDDISHLEPSNEASIFLKLLALNSSKTETLSLLTQNNEQLMTADGLNFRANKKIEVKE